MPVSPNYAFEKRQRELAKKKLEEKKARKRDAASSTPENTPAEPVGNEAIAPAATPEDAKEGPRVHRKR